MIIKYKNKEYDNFYYWNCISNLNPKIIFPNKIIGTVNTYYIDKEIENKNQMFFNTPLYEEYDQNNGIYKKIWRSVSHYKKFEGICLGTNLHLFLIKLNGFYVEVVE